MKTSSLCLGVILTGNKLGFNLAANLGQGDACLVNGRNPDSDSVCNPGGANKVDLTVSLGLGFNFDILIYPLSNPVDLGQE